MNALAQTFFINESATDVSGVFVTKLDLFFATKSTTHGITIELRECENGIPTRKVLPFSRTRLEPGAVAVDAVSGRTKTTFNFRAPVFLFAQQEYCFVIIPDGATIDYQVWVGEFGKPDLSAVPSRVITSSSATGMMYVSSTGRNWMPYEKENIKFVLHRAQFTSTSGVAVFENANTEYLHVGDPNGLFIYNERILVSNGVVTISSNAATSNSSAVIQLNTPAVNAQTAFTTNRQIYLRSNTGNVTIIRTVSSLPNTTHIIVNTAPTFNDGNVSIGHMHSNGSLYGELSVLKHPLRLMHLDNSVANSTVNFTALIQRAGYVGNSYLIGLESGASANLITVTDVGYSSIVPQFGALGIPRTSLTIQNRGTTIGNVTSAFITMQNDDDYDFVDSARRVRSYSNELYYGSGVKSLRTQITLRTDLSKITPVVDTVRSNMLTIQNIVNTANATLLANESNPAGGWMFNKYVSQRVQLIEGQEAEDLIVYLGAYRPLNTNIHVYCKLSAREDNELFEDKYWTPLTETSNAYSSKADTSDFVELQYQLPSGTNSTQTATAFRNTDNSGITRYYTSANSYFDGYATFAIKIVLTANQPQLIPKVTDLRAVALQI